MCILLNFENLYIFYFQIRAGVRGGGERHKRILISF